MRRLRIKINDQKFGEVGKLVSKAVRIGLGFAVVLSCLFSAFSSVEYASKYEEVIAKNSEYAESEEIRLGEEFLGCIREVTGGEQVSHRNSNSDNPDLLTRRNTLVNEIRSYLQQKKINIYNLNIYLLKEQSAGQEKQHWRVIRGWKLFIAQLPKILIVDNLTRVVSFIQNFFPPGIRTDDFLFYSEVFTKVLILKLIIWVLAGETTLSLFSSSADQKEERSGWFLESCYALFINFLPLSYSLISRSPPLYIQQMGSWGWIILYLCTILISTFLEEYAEKNPVVWFAEDEGKNIFLKKSFQLKVVSELLTYMFTSSYFFKNYFFSFCSEDIGKILLIANKLLSAMISVICYWKDRLNEKISEKAL